MNFRENWMPKLNSHEHYTLVTPLIKNGYKIFIHRCKYDKFPKMMKFGVFTIGVRSQHHGIHNLRCFLLCSITQHQTVPLYHIYCTLCPFCFKCNFHLCRGATLLDIVQNCMKSKDPVFCKKLIVAKLFQQLFEIIDPTTEYIVEKRSPTFG